MLSADLICSVLLSAPDAIVIIDASGTIQYSNSQASALFGYPSDELLGNSVDFLLPERFRPRHAAHRHGYISASRVRPMGSGLDLFARRKDGTEFPVEISLSPVANGPVLWVAAAIRDITDRKQAEAAILQARSEADRANETKSRFLATASHDLRQPLQSLALLNGSLRRLVSEPDAREALDQQSLAIEAMSRLLNSLLDISKLESGAIKPEIADFSVAALFADLRAEYQQVAHSKGLELVLEPNGHFVRSDPGLVGQILRNLISNALKYTRQGRVVVSAQRARDTISLAVLDTGIGIAPEQLNRIYDEFYQIGISPNTVRDGYGLGLSIVQRLARLLDAALGVESTPGLGTTFTLTVPEGSPSNERREQQRAATTPGSEPVPRHHVLLVEDDPGVRKATRILLTLEGFKVSAHASLDEATAAVQLSSDGIDVIVTDYHLAGNVTGTEVIMAVRKLLGRQIKAVLVTGDTSAAIRGIQMDDDLRMVSKPVNADELVTILRQFASADRREPAA